MDAREKLRESIRDLTHEIGLLLRQELKFIRREVAGALLAYMPSDAKWREFKHRGAALAACAVLMFFALLALVIAIIAGLSSFMPVWSAALLVAVALTLGAYFLLKTATKGNYTADLSQRTLGAMRNLTDR